MKRQSKLPKHLCRRRKEKTLQIRSNNSQTKGHVSVGGEGVAYKFPIVKELNPNPANRPGMEFRSSLSWFCPEISVRKYRNVPFITKSGKLSAHTLCVWRCYSEQLIMSLISTVNSRLLQILKKRFKSKLSRRWMNVSFKTSIVYILTRDNWVIDRFLGMAHPRGKASIKLAENHITYCVCELDENKRFVYSQAYFQANWLKFQVFRPRDKSSEKVNVGSHLRSLGILDVAQLDDNIKISNTFQISYNLWDMDVTFRSNSGAHYSRSLESLSVASETPYFDRDPEDFLSEDW
jgi:hypothetical protein